MCVRDATADKWNIVIYVYLFHSNLQNVRDTDEDKYKEAILPAQHRTHIPSSNVPVLMVNAELPPKSESQSHDKNFKLSTDNDQRWPCVIC